VRIIQEGLGDPVLVYPIAARVAEGGPGAFLGLRSVPNVEAVLQQSLTSTTHPAAKND
jgi:hypothetical protein